MRAIAALSLLLAAACGDPPPPADPDLSAVADGGGLPDLIGADLTCTQPPFEGFGGFSPTERRLACPCGCVIDGFRSTVVAGFWQQVTAGAAQFTPGPDGLTITATATGDETAVGALSSTGQTNTFWLDGDFDLLVDYELSGALPDGAHAILNVRDPSAMAVTDSYTIERERTLAGEERYTAYLGGVPHVRVPTGATSGTLQLRRTGRLVEAIASGDKVSQFTGGVVGRLAVFVNVTVEGCAVDGGSCSATVVWRNLRLLRGTLVDRR